MRAHARLLAAALAIAGLAAVGPAARGAAGLFLTWNDCAPAAAASHDLAWACDANTGVHRLYCAFGVPAAVDSVLGFELVVDVQHAEPILPDWWQFAPAGCRYGDLGADFDFATHAGCADFSRGRASGGVMGYFLTEPRGLPSQARIKVAGAWLPDLGYASLSPDSVYYAACILVSNDHTTGEGTVCGGCSPGACLVLNGMWIRRQPGAAGGDVELSQPGLDPSNWATWQGGAAANCAAVPVRVTTWGQLKGLYR